MKNQKMLRNALRGNAAFSTLSGLTLILFNGYFKNLFEANFALWPLGIGLLLFAAQLIYLTSKQEMPSKEVKLIIGMDLLWVIGSVVLLLAISGIPAPGRWVIILVAVMVADFALFQYVGLRKMKYV